MGAPPCLPMCVPLALCIHMPNPVLGWAAPGELEGGGLGPLGPADVPLPISTPTRAGGERCLTTPAAKRHTPVLPPRPALPRRREEEEKANAVEKRGHMGDFYRNLLRSNVAFGGKPAEAKPAARKAAEQAQQPAGESDRGRAADASAAEEAEEPQWLPRSPPREPARGREDEAGAQQPTEAAAPLEAAQQQQGQAAEQAQVKGASQAAGAQAPGRGSEGGNSEAAAGAAASPAELAARAGQRRNQEDAVAAARERYLARKRQRTGIQG